MKESAPKRGAGSDESHRATDLWQDSPSGTPWPGVVRTCSSNADRNQSNATPTDSARSQSERGLDSAERPPEGGSEARASGKREHRPERTENDGVSGAGAVPSAGWRSVAVALDAVGGMRP